MARHRRGLKRLYDLKPKAHAALSLLTRGRPGMARALDFFPEYGPPGRLAVLHDDQVRSTMAAPRYAVELARLMLHNRETVQAGPGIPPYPQLRRVVWQAEEIYVPGRILAPVDLALGRLVAFERAGPTNWSVTRPRLRRRPPLRVAGRAVAIPYMKHYGHLLTDILAPIAFAAHRGLISREDPVTVIAPRGDNPVATRFAEGMLALGLARQVVRIGRDEGALCDAYLQGEVLASSGEHKYAMPEVTPLLRDIFRAAGGGDGGGGGGGDTDTAAAGAHARVYLTRGDARLRRVAGEAELVAALRERGFHIFESRWDNHAEQLAVFGGFDLLVGVHGAGLANVIFGRPTARLVEIQAADARKTTGLYWASCAGMEYSCVLGGPEGPQQSFAIDPAEVLRVVDGLPR